MNDKELLNLFTDMVRAHTAYMDRQLSALGLSNGQGGVISVLGRYGSLTQNELAKFRQVTPATISIMLDRMERDGLVVRFTAKDNSRANNIRLTERGAEIFEKLDTFMSGEPEIVFNGLTDEEKTFAAEIFRKITENDSRKE